MSIRDVEKAAWREVAGVVNNNRLRLKDILEWSTGPVEPENELEVVVNCPHLGVNVCILKEHDKR